MKNARVVEEPPFRPGDNVVLAEGPYRGTPGVFLRVAEDDVTWAEIQRADGVVRCHPLIWLRSDPDASDPDAREPAVQARPAKAA